MKNSYKVNEEHEGKRLDLVLKFVFPQYSRQNARKLLDAGKITVNGAIEYRPNYKTRKGDEIEASLDGALARKELEGYELDLDVVYEDEHLLAVNKPSGLKVHPTASGEKKTLINAVYQHYKDKRVVSDYGYTLVNRIDQPTSGLVLIAKSPKGAAHYAQQFAKSLVGKHYVAVIAGDWNRIAKGNDWVELRDTLKYKDYKERQSVSLGAGQFSHTRAKLLKYIPELDCSAVLLKPITGRTHQLRIQLSERGYPILGDSKYGEEAEGRLMLHAYSLRIKNISGGELSLIAELPEEFFNYIDRAEKISKA